jgi:hypothetical protein
MNMATWKLIRLKSHDYHIITVLAELSYFYRQLCAKEITVEMMQKLGRRY